MDNRQRLLEKLKRRVQPTEEEYQFLDEELEAILEESVIDLDPDLDLETLPKEKENLVMWKAMSECYFILAGKHAENIRIRVEHDEYHGQYASGNYMKVGERYLKMYEENKGVDVRTVTRTQTGTNRKAPPYFGDKT